MYGTLNSWHHTNILMHNSTSHFWIWLLFIWSFFINFFAFFWLKGLTKSIMGVDNTEWIWCSFLFVTTQLCSPVQNRKTMTEWSQSMVLFVHLFYINTYSFTTKYFSLKFNRKFYKYNTFSYINFTYTFPEKKSTHYAIVVIKYAKRNWIFDIYTYTMFWELFFFAHHLPHQDKP